MLEACEQALEQAPPEREAWLTRTLADDPAMLANVRRLLTRDADASLSLPTETPEPPPERPRIPPPERIGPWRLTGLVGEGGMGAVYRAERDDGLFDQVVAVKLISSHRLTPASEQRFATERRALARLAHPNIARLIDGGVTGEGLPYLLMGYVEGVPITDHVRAADPSDAEIVELMAQVCAAVAEAHRRLVVHGDIKPSNILVAEPDELWGPRARLLDFGVARLMDIVEEGQPRSPVTAGYADPARRRGEPPTTADDIYALGLMLEELLSRRGPALGDTAPPRRVPLDLKAIAAKACAPAPADRYGSVDALASELQRWKAREPVEARKGGGAYVAGRLFARRPRIVAAAGLAILALAVIAVAATGLYLRAEAERREADRRFAQAGGMARYMLFDLFDALNRTPGTIGVRRDLVDTSRRYLDDLAASPRASIGLKADVAMGYLRLAGVLGLSGGGNLGEREQARAMLRKAQASLAVEPPGAASSAAWLHARGKLRLAQGFDVMVQGRGPAAAEPLLRRAAADLSAAAALAPGDAEILADLWETRLNLADLKTELNDPGASRAILEQELTAWPARAGPMAGNEKAPLLLAHTHALLGDALYNLKDLPAAADRYARAAQVLEEEDRRRPDRPRTLSALISAWWSQAGTLDELGRREQALDLYGRAVEAGRARLLADPENDNLRRQTSVAELDRAGLLARIGRREEALAEARGPLERARAAAERRPDDVVAVRGHLAALRPYADIERAVGRKAQACADYRAALAGWARYDLRFGLTPRLRETELGQIVEKLKACG